MLKDTTRSNVIAIWFSAAALVIVSMMAFGVAVTMDTGAFLVAMSLVPPLLVVMLWPISGPPMIAEELLDVQRRGSASRLRRKVANVRTLTICAIGVALLGEPASAQEFSRYRTFELGATVASVSTATGVVASQVQTLHERPAVLQEIEWRPSRWSTGTISASSDPVEQMVFSFYNDALYRIVVDYRHGATEGMTNADMIEAIAAVYGAPLAKSVRLPARVPSEVEAASGTAVARWGDTEHAIVLYRTSAYGDALRLIVTALPVDALARTAASQAKRMDEREAPSREIARQKQEQADGVAAAEKARVENKKIFLP
ncbi:MAG TPA: hypothetical protein VJP86_06420 [Vicinamibacterales bacterium]|jgi:hypothetical protein|nr:hypothetical protein [Vicinamibacterales bacterium]